MWRQDGTDDDYVTNPTWEENLTTFPQETGDDNMIGAMQGGDTLTFYVKTSKGDKIKFKLPSSTTIYDLKEKLAKSIDIPTIEQSLSYNGAPLANENTLAYYQILPESVVKMGKKHLRLPLFLPSPPLSLLLLLKSSFRTLLGPPGPRAAVCWT